ncbi:hypothetical protein V8E36_003608 [Tilletia maclaganii]
MSIGASITGTSLRFGVLHNQIERDDAEQQLLDAYVKDAAESKPISTRKLAQQQLRQAALVDAHQGNSAAGAARPPSLARLALEVTARNFTRLLRITPGGDEEEGEAGSKLTAVTQSSARRDAPAPAPRKSSRVAAIAQPAGRATHPTLFIGEDGRPSIELSRRTHDRLRLLPAQHLASLQLLLQAMHRRALTLLTLRRYFLPPTNARLHLSPAIPLITEQPSAGPIRLLSTISMHAQHLTHASLIALNRVDAKHLIRFTSQATNLEYLDLSACLGVNVAVVRALAKACRDAGKRSRLRYLNLDATAVGAPGLALVIASFHQLEVLKAANVQGLDDGIVPEAILTAISAEAELDSASGQVSSASKPFGRLRSLKLRRTAVGNESLALLLSMCDPELLQTLDIGFTQCNLEGLLHAIKADPIPDTASVDPAAALLKDLTPAMSRSRNASVEPHSNLEGAGPSSSQLTGLLSRGEPPSTSQSIDRSAQLNGALKNDTQDSVDLQPEYAAKFSFTKLSLSGLNLYTSRGSTASRTQPLQDLLRTQTELQSLYLQRIPHFGREYSHVQELTAVLHEGLRSILEKRAGSSGLPTLGLEAEIPPIPAPLFKRLILSDNPALGYRVMEGKTSRYHQGGYYYEYELKEQEEAEAGELAKLMRSVGVFCEELRLSNVNLQPFQLVFSPYQRILELDRTGIENAMVLDALKEARMVIADAEPEPPSSWAGKELIWLGGKITRSGRGPPAPPPVKWNAKGKGKAKEQTVLRTVTGNLRRISLVDAKVSDESLKPLLEVNPYLQEIDLTSCRSVPVVQRRNYFEHLYGEEAADPDTEAQSQSDADSYETRQRHSRLNPHRSRSDRQAAIARRQAASGTTLTRQEMIDDDFVMDSDSDFDEYGGSRKRQRRSSSSSPRKRTQSGSPSKVSRIATSRAAHARQKEEALQAVKSAKTARLAAAARLSAAAYYPISASNTSRTPRATAQASATNIPKNNSTNAASESSDELSELTASDMSTSEDEDSDEADDRPLSQRRRTRRPQISSAAGASSRPSRSRPTRSAARNLSLVDALNYNDDEDEDPDFDVSTARASIRRSPNRASRLHGGKPSQIGSSSAAAGPSPFASSSGTVADRPTQSQPARRSISPTRSASTRVREQAERARERARELASEEDQAARAARAARRAKAP